MYSYDKIYILHKYYENIIIRKGIKYSTDVILERPNYFERAM